MLPDGRIQLRAITIRTTPIIMPISHQPKSASRPALVLTSLLRLFTLFRARSKDPSRAVLLGMCVCNSVRPPLHTHLLLWPASSLRPFYSALAIFDVASTCSPKEAMWRSVCGQGVCGVVHKPLLIVVDVMNPLPCFGDAQVGMRASRIPP